MLLRTVAGTFRLRVLAGLPAPTIWMVTPAGAPSSEYATVPAKPLIGVTVATKLELVLVALGRIRPVVTGRAVSVKSVTVNVAGLEVINPDLAVTLVVPMAAPVAIPVVGPMLAIVGRLEAQVKVTLGIATPFRSLAMAVKPCVPPTKMLTGVGVTVMLATAGAVTVSVAGLEVIPNALAVMLVLPVIACAVARPLAPIVATVN